MEVWTERARERERKREWSTTTAASGHAKGIRHALDTLTRARTQIEEAMTAARKGDLAPYHASLQ